MATDADQALRAALPGHCTNCHAEFDAETGNQLCPPCARAYVIGLSAGGGKDLRRSYRTGFDRGWDSGFEQGLATQQVRIRNLFLYREEFGFETLADVVQALWPEGDDG